MGDDVKDDDLDDGDNDDDCDGLEEEEVDETGAIFKSTDNGNGNNRGHSDDIVEDISGDEDGLSE